MKLLEPSVHKIVQGNDPVSMFKHVELVGRVAYRSEGNVTDTSYRYFLERMKNLEHLSVLRHGTLYLTAKANSGVANAFIDNKFSEVVIYRGNAYITTNFQVVYEMGKEDVMLPLMVEPTVFHIKRHTYQVVTSIGVSREFNRHSFDILEQSTRYCNYSKDKFGSELNVIYPTGYDMKRLDYLNSLSEEELKDETLLTKEDVWFESMKDAEKHYMQFINELKLPPQEARRVLPLDTASMVYYTASEPIWEHFFKLRIAPNVHPDAIKVATMIQEDYSVNK